MPPQLNENNSSRYAHSPHSHSHSSRNWDAPAPVVKKEKKFKKPKHLKRKLASVADDQVREHLLKELKTFEEIKDKQSTSTYQPVKKHKVSPSKPPPKARPTPQSNVREEKSFPREPKEEATKKRPVAVKPAPPAKMKETAPPAKEKEPKVTPKAHTKAPLATKKVIDSSGNSKDDSVNPVEPTRQREKRRRGRKDTSNLIVEQAPEEAVGEPGGEAKEHVTPKASDVSNKRPKKDDPPKPVAQAAPKAAKKEPKVTLKPKAKTPPAEKKVVEDSDSDSDSDSEDSVASEGPTRTRGKGRRGRQDTSIKIVEEAPEEPAVEEPVDPNAPDPSKKTAKKDDHRYCVGRKPVTDYKIDEKYDGKVVYSKPFGVFIDIGCHSDAFCHVSRLADDFVKSPGDAVKDGDIVSARIVEIDRHKKRITVSLQSDTKIADERKSMEAHGQRREKIQAKKKAQLAAAAPPSSEPAQLEQRQPTFKRPEPTVVTRIKPESEMDPAELKRARKLARRAARREERGEDETPANE